MRTSKKLTEVEIFIFRMLLLELWNRSTIPIKEFAYEIGVTRATLYVWRHGIFSRATHPRHKHYRKLLAYSPKVLGESTFSRIIHLSTRDEEDRRRALGETMGVFSSRISSSVTQKTYGKSHRTYRRQKDSSQRIGNPQRSDSCAFESHSEVCT